MVLKLVARLVLWKNLLVAYALEKVADALCRVLFPLYGTSTHFSGAGGVARLAAMLRSDLRNVALPIA